MKTEYLHIKYYNKILSKTKKRNVEFQTEETTFTATILTDDKRIIFNKEGDSDNKVLSLIKAVRDDANAYMESSAYTFRSPTKDKVNFFGLLDVLDNNSILTKVDVKSAYWERAKQKGVITNLTDLKYKKNFEGYETQYAKEARLKALGSTATAKHYKFYAKGKNKSELFDEFILQQKTRQVYLELCRDIDELMLEMKRNIKGCKYYYWDCMFLEKEFAEKAVQFLKDKGYSSSSQETTVEYVKIDGIGYLVSSSDDKIYMTRKETGYLLEDDSVAGFGGVSNDFMLEDYI